MKNVMKEQIATLQEMYDGASDTMKDEIVSKVIELAATEEPATVEENADATTANVEEQIATLQKMYDGANDATKDEIVNKVINLAATEEPATVEETATVEKTAAEKFLEAKKEIRLSHGRYLGNDRFADQWQKHNGFRWVNISKKTAAFELEFFHGLTIDEFLTEQKNYVDNEVAKSLAQMAIDDQADFISDKIRRESKVDDEDVFSLLPALDELNDVEDEELAVKEDVVHMYGKTFRFINIGGERVTFIDGEVHIIGSDRYDAHFNRKTGKYVAAIVDENGNFKPKTFDTEEEFFAEMERRGACTIEPGTPEPDDNFTAELAKLQAQVESARAEAEDARDAFRAAQKVCNDAEQNCIAADNKAYEAEAAVEKFIRAKANALTKIIDNAPDIITAPRMAVTLQGGEVKRMKFGNLAVNYLNGKFLFDCDCDWQTLAEYDTPAQVETVIGELRAAIAHGSKKFTFPTFGTQVGGIFKELDAIKATA